MSGKGTLRGTSIAKTAVTTATAAVAGMAWAVRGRSSAVFGPSVWRGEPGRKAIALTFDDGPGPATLQILDILARHNAPATFFQCGANVRRLPEAAREVAAAGHELGNHTDTHPFLHFKSRDFIYREIAAAQESIAEITGVRPRLFRAPFGVRWFGLRDAQQRLGLTGVMWTTLALDWKWPAGRVFERLLRGASNDAIFCLHDGRRIEKRPDIRVTLQTLRQLLPELMEQGFHFEKVTDILCPTKN
jgi:peptidoglycan-N-acetylglucosamine deacetylase